MKHILVTYYSQTGQLKRILDRLLAPFENPNEYEIEYFEIKLKHKFPFPWNRHEFFDAMPDSVQETLYDLEDNNKPLRDQYDLIVMGYQIWFLSPSIPINSFLGSKWVESNFSNSPVFTLCAGRNMWVMAHERIKQKFKDLNVNHIGHVALVDRSPNLVSVITIIYWLFHGKTDRLLNFFPRPGVLQEDIDNCEKFGSLLKNSLDATEFKELQSEIVNADGVFLKHQIISMETKAKKVFIVWAKIINGLGKKGTLGRKIALLLFETYLYFVILFISPLISIFSTFAAIFRRKAIKKKMVHYSGL